MSSKFTYNLFLDDFRFPKGAFVYATEKKLLEETNTSNGDWVIARDHAQFVKALELFGLPSRVSFDHDLHQEHMDDYHKRVRLGFRPDYENYTIPTGVDSAKSLVALIKTYPDLPIPSITIHSANALGRIEIAKVLQHYL